MAVEIDDERTADLHCRDAAFVRDVYGPHVGSVQRRRAVPMGRPVAKPSAGPAGKMAATEV
jgi:hypothetical protein